MTRAQPVCAGGDTPPTRRVDLGLLPLKPS
jgi:hypothetical protein